MGKAIFLLSFFMLELSYTDSIRANAEKPSKDIIAKQKTHAYPLELCRASAQSRDILDILDNSILQLIRAKKENRLTIEYLNEFKKELAKTLTAKIPVDTRYLVYNADPYIEMNTIRPYNLHNSMHPFPYINWIQKEIERLRDLYLTSHNSKHEVGWEEADLAIQELSKFSDILNQIYNTTKRPVTDMTSKLDRILFFNDITLERLEKMQQLLGSAIHNRELAYSESRCPVSEVSNFLQNLKVGDGLLQREHASKSSIDSIEEERFEEGTDAPSCSSQKENSVKASNA